MGTNEFFVLHGIIEQGVCQYDVELLTQ